MPHKNSDTIDNISKKKRILERRKDNLLSKAKVHWFYGEWDKLAEYGSVDLEHHPDAAYILLLASAAHQQLGNFELAKKLGRQSLALGCEPKFFTKICIAGAYNILGRIAALQNNEKKIEESFSESVNIDGDKDIDFIVHSRAIREISKLGLLPQAAQFIDRHLNVLTEKDPQFKNDSVQLKILRTELELLSHELNLSLQRNQLYKSIEKEANEPEKNSIGTPAHLERLKKKSTSQLGQDIWVLEKSNFKKKGFFVEFGATDGVLLSNTFLLEKEFGWEGICAEPNPKFFEQLKKNRSCIVSNACIGATTGEKVDFVFAQEYGGMEKHMFDDMHSDKRQAYLEQGNAMKIETISLHDFLINHKVSRKIDYLSIDTEGSEFDILENFPFEEWDIGLLSVEHNFTKMRDKLFELLKSFGYKRIEAQWDDWFYK